MNPWDDPAIAREQWEGAQRELASWREGRVWPHFESLANCVRAVQPPSVLELGCGSGYLSEVVAAAAPRAAYSGCDTSRAALALARANYPLHEFRFTDVRATPYLQGEFDCVISGSVLVHLDAAEWPAAVAEAARIAKRFVIFYKTRIRPEHRASETTIKHAYGAEIPETSINETEWERMLAAAGLAIVQTHRWRGDSDPNQVTHLCRKDAS